MARRRRQSAFFQDGSHPNELMKPVHETAMPVVLTTPAEVDQWLHAPIARRNEGGLGSGRRFMGSPWLLRSGRSTGNPSQVQRPSLNCGNEIMMGTTRPSRSDRSGVSTSPRHSAWECGSRCRCFRPARARMCKWRARPTTTLTLRWHGGSSWTFVREFFYALVQSK
jgi:hypothetical protein